MFTEDSGRLHQDAISRGGHDAVLDASRVWPDLISGRALIVNSGVTTSHHYFHLLTTDEDRDTTKLNSRQIKLLERVLLGQSQKVVASDSRCSVSTVATEVRNCLRVFGLRCNASHVPALLVFLFHALRGSARSGEVLVETRSSPKGELHIVRSPRPEHSLLGRVSHSELAVITGIVDGKSHAEIARQQGKSPRTVANQIGSVYRKLGVSGRLQLICYLVSSLHADGERSEPCN